MVDEICGWRAIALLLAGMLLWFGLASATAVAGPPAHAPLLGENIEGLDHACGTAVDSEGDLYVSSAGDSKIYVFEPGRHGLGEQLAEIADPHEPCGLAVDSNGTLYVSNQAAGEVEVVKYAPDAFPLSALPIYGPAETVDSSENARGIAVDAVDDRLYVAEGGRVSVFQADGTTGQDEIQSVRVQPSVTGGTFTLKFQAQVTGAISYAVTPAELQSDLEGLSTIGTGNVTVEEGNVGTRSYLVTFTHARGSKDMPPLEVNSSGLTGGSVEINFNFGRDPGQRDGFEFDGHIAEGELSGASAVASYTYRARNGGERHYLFVATNDEIDVLRGPAVNALTPKATIDGSGTPEGSFGFGVAGGVLGSSSSDGHLFVYDDAHKVLDEFDASGRYLDQTESASFEDAEPSGIAVLPGRSAVQELEGIGSARLGYGGAQTAQLPGTPSAADVQTALEALPSIGSGNVSVARHSLIGGGGFRYIVSFTRALSHRRVGRIAIDLGGKSAVSIARTTRLVEGSGPQARLYATAGTSTGAKLLAFTGLPVPGRASIPPLSRKLTSAAAVAVDSHGDVYVAAGARVHVYRPDGSEINVTFDDEDNLSEIAVDSTGKVYVLDKFDGSEAVPPQVTYYTPNAYPPVDGTIYARHEPPVLTRNELGGCGSCYPVSIAVDPSNDHLVTVGGVNLEKIKEFDSAANGNGFLRDIASSLSFGERPSVRVCGATGEIYVAEHAGQISLLDAAGTERVSQFDGSGSPNGPLHVNPGIAVDQANCHVLVLPKQMTASPSDQEVVREFDASGASVTGFGSFAAAASLIPAGIAVDNSGGPDDGNVYVAYDDPSPAQEFDLFAFTPLDYGEAPAVTAAPASDFGGEEAIVHGTVNPNGSVLEACSFEYITAAQYEANQKASLEPFAGAATKGCVESPEAIGEGMAPVAVHAQLQGLDLESDYRFRLVAVNQFGEGSAEGLFGPPEVAPLPALPVLFGEAGLRAKVDPWGLTTTYRFQYGTTESYGLSTPASVIAAGDGFVEVEANATGLSEGQTYHFRLIAENEASPQPVTGPDRTFTTQQRQNQPSCENAEYRTGLSAHLPDCRAYELVTPAETNGLIPSAYNMSSHGAEFGFKNWLVRPRGAGGGEVVSYFTLGTLPGFDGNGSLDGYRAERAAGDHPAAGWGSQLFAPTYKQAVPDFTHSVSPEGLSADQLYSFWQLEPVASFLETLPAGSELRTPSGFEPVGRGELAGELVTDHGARSRYLSSGGAHVIFSSDEHLEDEAPLAGTTAIYDRAAGSPQATVLSVQPGGSPFATDATYLGANEAGTAVAFAAGGALYLHEEGLTTEVAPTYTKFDAISADGKRLFYNTAAGLRVFELGAGSQTIEAAASFVAASADGSHAFFSAEEGGQRNLYAWDGTATSPIAQLDPADPADLPARSTPTGNVFVFESRAKLSAYENEGKREIYRYDPAAEPTLLCVSCDPSEAPPGAGATLIEYDGSEVAATTLIENVTDDGDRVIFESPDRLLPQDANDVADVYEWTVEGGGGCGREAGCLGLISSGQGDKPNHLYGMSADGRDVFFLTREKLLGADLAGSPSLYDARIRGGIPDPVPVAPCQGDACQGSGGEPPVLPSPATTGGGNGNQPHAPPGHCRRGRHRVHGRCVPNKRRKHGKHRHAGAHGQGTSR